MKKVTDDAKASGLDVSDNWVLSGGIRSWEEATRRLGELEAGLNARSELRSALEKHRDELMTSLDVTAVKELLTELEVRSKEMPTLEIDPLKERAAMAKAQLSVHQDLCSCISSKEISEVESALQKATVVGLDQPAQCLLPDGGKILERAKHWKANWRLVRSTMLSTSLSRQRCCSARSMSRRCRHTSNCVSVSASAATRLRH